MPVCFDLCEEYIHRAQSVSRAAPAVLLRSLVCPTCHEKAWVQKRHPNCWAELHSAGSSRDALLGRVSGDHRVHSSPSMSKLFSKCNAKCNMLARTVEVRRAAPQRRAACSSAGDCDACRQLHVFMAVWPTWRSHCGSKPRKASW